MESNQDLTNRLIQHVTNVSQSLVTKGGKVLVKMEDLFDTPDDAPTEGESDNVLIYNYITNEYYYGDATEIAGFDEGAQDAVGDIFVDSATIDFTYNDSTPSITADVVGGGLEWVDAPASTDAVINTGYVANNVGQIVITLPETAVFGSVVAVTGKGAGGWKIAQNAGQTIHGPYFSSITGVTGYVESINYLDGVTLLCITADTDWKIIWSTGNLTINV